MTLRIKENYRFWFKLTLIYFLIQNLVRSVFIFERPPGLIDTIDSYFDGALWDSGTWIIMSIPLVLFCLFIPSRYHYQFLKSKFNFFVTFLITTIFTLVAFCELTFWNEFHSRFNFIAVDYLIYTNEVLSNLKESYPMPPIIAGILIFSLLLTYISTKIQFSEWKNEFNLNHAVTALILTVTLPLIFIFFGGPILETHDDNFHDDQIARNGAYEFVRAFRSNKIDYKSFYAILPTQEIEKIYNSKKILSTPPPFDLKVKKPNIVMIVVESLGAKFIGPLSSNKDTTPYLNKLASESLFFKNFYANGTRTVRGLEALSLSVPPTPGYAVVKRPDHHGLYSIGNTFLNNGYDPIFLYGGRGFFDNMNSFFSNNHFQVVDQVDFKKDEITFTNAWGVCDEDMFKKAHQIILQHDPEKPFLMFMLTTSNHRPFTYPNGKIDIPSGASRQGAVKYTDFAIGQFLENVKNEKWAKNTIFVVVADHSTEGRGQFDLEMADFHIPLWIYSPTLLKPQVITKLGSQIDLLPTLIHMLDLKDDSPFFGRSFFNPNWTDERAFIGNYQYVGYYRNNVLTTLGPNKIVRNYSYDPATKEQSPLKDSPYLNEAIMYYQTASHMLDTGMYKSAH